VTNANPALRPAELRLTAAWPAFGNGAMNTFGSGATLPLAANGYLSVPPALLLDQHVEDMRPSTRALAGCESPDALRPNDSNPPTAAGSLTRFTRLAAAPLTSTWTARDLAPSSPLRRNHSAETILQQKPFRGNHFAESFLAGWQKRFRQFKELTSTNVANITILRPVKAAAAYKDKAMTQPEIGVPPIFESVVQQPGQRAWLAMPDRQWTAQTARRATCRPSS
jgi:hypothetical protein